MYKIDIAGLKVDCTTREELLKTVEQRMRAGERTFITTPYSEFLYHALHDPELLKTLNQADISVPDGIGIFWAAKFLSIKFIFQNYWLKILESLWQILYTLTAIVISPSYLKRGQGGDILLNEKIPGSELVWDLAKLAAKNNWPIYLLGGFDDTPELAADNLEKYCHTLIPRGRERSTYKLVAGYSNKNPDDPLVYEDIKKANPDMVFVAYGPLRQERWIAANMQNLPGKLYIGLGGTFDYIAGKQPQPPKFVRRVGLEWFYRLITQPKRVKRIYHATFGLIITLLKYKIQYSLPYRKNVVSIILNRNNHVFVGLRKPDKLERNHNHWMFPQGGIEANEDVVQGAKREVFEETGIQTLEFIKISEKKNIYLWDFGFSREFRGQEQSIVYFKFNGNEDEINLKNHHTQEFIDYKWIPISQVKDTLHLLRKPLGEIAQGDLKNLA